MSKKIYNSGFYAQQIDGSIRSAEIILKILFELYQPKSVLDLGCGRGGWLSASHKLGSIKLTGMDGEWINFEDLVDKKIKFFPINFEKKIDIIGKYDLCVSTEVAEHLSENRAQDFVRTLCDSSDVVLFSAAIKSQGGTNHINEQPQSYWVSKFNESGFECFDVFREKIWDNDDVEVWYRQNILLFVSKKSQVIDFDKLVNYKPKILDIVHPLMLQGKEEGWLEIVRNKNRRIDEPTLRFLMGRIWKFFFKKMLIK